MSISFSGDTPEQVLTSPVVQPEDGGEDLAEGPVDIRLSGLRMAATGFFMALIAGILLMGLGLIFLEPLVRLLGSTDTILPYATSYIRLILIGCPWMTASLVLNNQLRFQGNALFAMIGIGSGGLINMALDPLLIFAFGMGISGAALATIISQLISFCLLLIGTMKSDNLKIRFRNFPPKPHYLAEIFRGGAPSLFRQGIGSIATTILNNAAGAFGDPAIAAMSIVSRVMMFANSLVIGFGQGFQPVCGFNYGAKKYGRVREGFFFCVKVCTLFLVCAAILGLIFAPSILGWFRADDPEVIRIGALALRNGKACVGAGRQLEGIGEREVRHVHARMQPARAAQEGLAC